MATGALRSSYAITSRSRESFDDECRFSKPAVFVESAPRKRVVGPAPGARDIARGFRRIIHFPLGADLSDCRLPVALRTNANAFAIADLTEVDRGLHDIFIRRMA